MVSLRGPVVGLGGQDLIIEVAKVYRLAVKANTSLPAPFLTSPCNALIFGTEGSVLSFRLISGVLSGSRRAQVRLAIVQSLAINMVYEQMIGYFDYFTVHGDPLSFGVVDTPPTNCIIIAKMFGCTPFVPRQAPVIIGIDDCILALGQRDSAEGVAVAQAPI